MRKRLIPFFVVCAGIVACSEAPKEAAPEANEPIQHEVQELENATKALEETTQEIEQTATELDSLLNDL